MKQPTLESVVESDHPEVDEAPGACIRSLVSTFVNLKIETFGSVPGWKLWEEWEVLVCVRNSSSPAGDQDSLHCRILSRVVSRVHGTPVTSAVQSVARSPFPWRCSSDLAWNHGQMTCDDLWLVGWNALPMTGLIQVPLSIFIVGCYIWGARPSLNV